MPGAGLVTVDRELLSCDDESVDVLVEVEVLVVVSPLAAGGASVEVFAPAPVDPQEPDVLPFLPFVPVVASAEAPLGEAVVVAEPLPVESLGVVVVDERVVVLSEVVCLSTLVLADESFVSAASAGAATRTVPARMVAMRRGDRNLPGSRHERRRQRALHPPQHDVLDLGRRAHLRALRVVPLRAQRHAQPRLRVAGRDDHDAQGEMMTIELDHVMVPARDKRAAARMLAELLGVPWAEDGVGPFVPVFVNDGLTLDFDEWPEPIPQIHHCFRVSEDEFDAILERIRAAGLPYRSEPHGPADAAVGRWNGGRLVYWDQPDGHVWQILTRSYARQGG